jgi:hypothetical protein
MRTCGMASAAMAIVAASSGCFVLLDHDLADGPAEEVVVRREDFAGFLSWAHVGVGDVAAVPARRARPHRLPE